MIITEQFVMLNFPKTGSSFTRSVLKQLYRKYQALPYTILMRLGLTTYRTMFEYLAPVVDSNRVLGRKGQHGTYRQIPPEHRHKKIVSVVRNPFDRYVSAYLFQWWQKYPLAPVDQLRAVWPHYPELSFAEYYELLHRFGREERLHGVQLKTDLGYSTVQFIQFYFPDPDAVLAVLDDDYLSQKKYTSHLEDVTFLHQENLNQELYNFLTSLGYPEAEIQFIKHAEKQNVTQRTEDQKKTRDFYTPELIEQVYQRDALLFDLFPEYKNLEFSMHA